MVDRFEREEAKEKGARVKRAPTPRRKKPPEELAYLLDWYDDIRAGQARGMEVEPLSHQEILAFFTLHDHLDWDSFDVYTLRDLDGPWFKTLPKSEGNIPSVNRQPRSNLPPGVGRPVGRR